MKSKVLINYCDSNFVIKEFFDYTKDYFDCLTTSRFWSDVKEHFDFFRPDIYLVFMDNPFSESINQISALKTNEDFRNIPVVLVGKREDCHVIEQNMPDLADVLFRLPISTDNIALGILSFIERGKKAKEENNVKKRILIVDDDRTILKMVKAALEAEFDVTALANGMHVQRFLLQNDVDLVILDYEMPMMTGAEVYKEIKKMPKLANIPVCFLTGVSDRAKVMEIMSLRPKAYLLKPLNIETLISTINNLT